MRLKPAKSARLACGTSAAMCVLLAFLWVASKSGERYLVFTDPYRHLWWAQADEGLLRLDIVTRWPNREPIWFMWSPAFRHGIRVHRLGPALWGDYCDSPDATCPHPWYVAHQFGRAVFLHGVTRVPVFPDGDASWFRTIEDFDRHGSFGDWSPELPHVSVRLPIWVAVSTTALPTACWVGAVAFRSLRHGRRRRRGLCARCGYDLRCTSEAGGPLLGRCPECGTNASYCAPRLASR